MSTPLYKSLKSRGTSFYAFPSASSDINLANYNDYYNLNFTKFALLNIPKQTLSNNSMNDGVMEFIPKSNSGDAPFYCDDPNTSKPTLLSDQLVESLRNYVANYDTVLHESRINTNTDFYNIAERYTPTEEIFWKWVRKLNMIDFEPAVHKVDWDKNLTDFDNTNNSTINNTDYFREYLWKEREIIDYSTTWVEESTDDYQGSDGYHTPKFTISGQTAKFKVGDKVILNSNISADISNLPAITFGYSYKIAYIEFSSGNTYIWIDTNFQGQSETSLIGSVFDLDYHKLIEYVGEINQITNIQTASRVGQEVTAYIPNQGGETPTILFGIRSNTNYYPNLEIPILSDEIQTEIIGAESLNSIIRTNPQDYPGSFYGQFDTADNTYICSDGDNMRYQGDYYGINLTNNTGLNADDYIEKLTDFNSNDIDGVFLDVDRTHYYKMNIAGLECKNFDEFSSLSIQGQAPKDFEFNAILWYYELVEKDNNNNINSYVNLYGIEFLNNPDNDDDNFATQITPYNKLVTNGVQDGLSYMFNLNINYNIDNDVEPLTYDPTTIYNMFGFDMYNEMMKRFYQVNENFINIINQFVRMNLDIQEIKSLIYSQTDIDALKSQMSNMQNLLTLYSTNQFVDSDSTAISVDYSGIYPKLKMNVITVEYDEIENISISEVYNYNLSNTGASYPISASFTSNMLLNIINDNISTKGGNAIIMLDQDLKNKQKLDILIEPKYAQYIQKLYFNMMFNYNDTSSEINIFYTDLPKDIVTGKYVNLTPEKSVFDDSFYLNENIYVNCTDVYTGNTLCVEGEYVELILTEDMFKSGNTIYVQNLYFKDTFGNVIDYSGAYTIMNKVGINITISLLQSSVCGYISIGQPRVSYYRGLQVTILRVDGTNTSTFADRYNITYKII